MRPRCGRLMTPYEAVWGALLDDVMCGRPLGHNGQCRSVQAVSKERERYRANWPKYREKRQQRREMRRAQEKARDELAIIVRVAAKQARDRELAKRAVKW